ncbi:PBSX family phage terminase large subunit [Clostridia bacterium OttesenSCG-928-O13]|nr:PBSX family phage terminase large subunit [Clostridia bacterium OttesenSCG-928-O13]
MVMPMAAKVNNAMADINPAFYGLWISEAGHVLAKGGRSSFKSSTISKKLVEKKMRRPMSNVVCMRQYENTILKSVYSQIRWALREAGVADRFEYTKRPMQIIHKDTGTGFYFAGGSDPDKLKSFVIPVGYVSDVWLEEMDSFGGEEAIDTIEDTFIRETVPDGEQVQIWGSWNPPRNPYAWINEYVEKHRDDPDYYIHHSTYLDDVRGFNSKQIIDKINRYKENDLDYYRWMYLGEVIGMGDNVYNMALFHPLQSLQDLGTEEKPETLVALFYAVDTGHQVSATTCLCIGLLASGKVVLLDTYYYSPAGRPTKKAPSELAADLNAFVSRTSKQYPVRIAKRTIDSAEGGLRNQYFLDFGIRWNPVNKLAKADMIDRVHDLLAQGRVYYLNIPANQIFVDEHKRYEWKPTTLHTANPDVIKENDHTCDAFQYFVVDNLRELGMLTRR